jgi:zinc finger protein CreA/MIG
MEAGDGAQRKLPIPMVPNKQTNYTVKELVDPDSGHTSGRNSARQSEAGDIYDRM